MGFWIDDDTYQFVDVNEMAASLGIDLETAEGDYGESYHWCNKIWEAVEIDKRFD